MPYVLFQSLINGLSVLDEAFDHEYNYLWRALLFFRCWPS